jgi:hypothetical protein
MNKCNVCKKEKKNVNFVPTSRQLIFGGFNLTFEYRCEKCDQKLSKKLMRMIK